MIGSRRRARLNIVLFTVVFSFIAACATALTIHQAQAIEFERTKDSVNAMIRSRVNRMAALAEDNAIWDDAALAVYRQDIDRGFIERTWTPTAETGVNYAGVFLFSADGQLLYGHGADREPNEQAIVALRSLVMSLGRSLNGDHQSSGGIFLGQSGPELVGVAAIAPIDQTLTLEKPWGQNRVFLVFTRPLAGVALSEMGDILQLNNLRWSRSAGMTEVVHNGIMMGSVSWTPPNEGFRVLLRGAPVILAAVAAALIAMFQLLNHNGRIIDHLSRISRQDALTGLLNRRGFHEALASVKGLPAGLALLSIGGLKAVNADHGHAVGDALLRFCGEYLRKVAPAASLARIDGDEFAVIVRGIDARAQLTCIADALSQRATQSIVVEGREVDLRIAAGLSATIADNVDADLFSMSELALRHSQREPSLAACWHSAEQEDAQRIERDMALRLRQAIADEELEVHYQPVFHKGGARIVGVEALVRWSNGHGGFVSPATFVPIAERHGLIIDLGAFVLRRACEDASHWPDIRLAVNVSTAQLNSATYCDVVKTIIEQTGFDPSRLDLEVTETLLIHETELAKLTIDRLRTMGVGVVLDDFGAGFASIGMVRQFGFTKLKLDRSLIDQIVTSEQDRNVAAATVMLARALGLKVSAEGVETQDQATLVSIAGCDEVQGWLYAKAMPAEALTAFLLAKCAPPEFRCSRAA